MTAEGPPLIVEPLGPSHNRADFGCGVEPLDLYLRRQAGQDARRGVAATFVAVEPKSSKVAGFYTLSMTALDLADLPSEAVRKLPRYPKVPAILLGRLAVDARHAGRGLGKFLLMDAAARSLRSEIAWFALVVDAKDDAAREFYARFGFETFPDHRNRLFITKSKLAVALAD